MKEAVKGRAEPWIAWLHGPYHKFLRWVNGPLVIRPAILLMCVVGSGHPSFAQDLLAPDPWSLHRLSLENSRAQYDTLGVARVDLYHCSPRRNGRYKKTHRSTMTLNEDGNPASIRERVSGRGGISDGPVDPSRFRASQYGQVEYQFTYSTSGKIAHIAIHEAEHPKARMEIDVRNEYDRSDRLVRQTVEERHIYKEGYRYRGVQYPNDTSVVVYSLSYSGDGKIQYLTRATDTTCCDTLHQDIPMEQLFASSAIGSTGRDTVEVNIAQGHALLIDGRCVPIPSDMVWRSIYLNGQLVTKERVDTDTGRIVEQWSTTYLENSLYDATRYQSGAPYWKAEYTFRK